MCTELDRIGCSFPACHSGWAKYQTCLILHQPSMTMYPDLGSTHLENILLWVSMA